MPLSRKFSTPTPIPYPKPKNSVVTPKKNKKKMTFTPSILRFKTPPQILINYSLLTILNIYLLTTSLLNILDTTASLLTHLPTQPTKNGACNGHASLCTRSYSNITHLATHDSAFIGGLPNSNQNLPLTRQLDAGIRFLTAQTHKSIFYDEVKLCHTSCLLKDGGSLESYLLVLREWVEEHPTEVVTLLLTNGDFLPKSAFIPAFQGAGIVPYAYIPDLEVHKADDKSTWPTLGEMLRRGQRVVVFMDYGADDHVVDQKENDTNNNGTDFQNETPYLLPEFTYFWETPFDTTDPWFGQCAIDRPAALSSSSSSRTTNTITTTIPQPLREEQVTQRMYILNHFLDTRFLGMEIPDRRDAAHTNAIGGEAGIGTQVERCVGMYREWGEGGVGWPKAVLVDYFDRGEGLGWERGVNGVGEI